MVCFIILHYMAVNETISCVNSIKKTINENKKIVIVDNNSNNGSGNKLFDFYMSDNEIKVIRNNSNLGFAKGNNVGYLYAKQKWNPDFIIILNNDVEIIQSDFYEKIQTIYEKEKFYILGPDIISSSIGIHQSPKQLGHITKKELIKINKKIDNQMQHNHYLVVKCFLKKFFILRKIIYKYRSYKKNIDFNKKYYNVPLHGACLIFSKLYIEKKEYAFYPKTFFYYETEILDYLCNREKLKVIYDPQLCVIHKQNVSTNLVYRNMIDKTRFSQECSKQSISTFIELIEENARG